MASNNFRLHSLENTNMTCNVGRIINLILDDNTKPRSCVKHPCCICKKTVKTVHQAILCDSCKLWSHIGCNGMSKNEYDNLKYKSDPWICLVFNIKNNLESLIFTQCDNTELININCTNSMRFLESLPNVDIINETLAFSDVSSNDINNALPIKTSCKYYSVNDYHTVITSKKTFSIFYSNVNGLGSKSDNLVEFLSTTSTTMDIVAITETSEKEDL